MMPLEDVADMLAEYRRAKVRAKEIRTEMVKFVVEELGMDQQEASQLEIYAFLDGYLVGKGMAQTWRGLKSD